MGWKPTGGGGGGTSLTTKGDLHGYDTEDKRIPVGSNDQVLTADSAQALGVKWAAAAGGGGGIPEWISYLAARQSDESAHTDDDFFNDGSIAGAWTELDVSGTTTWTESRDVLSVVFDDQTAQDMCCQLKSITSASAPMTIETRVRAQVPDVDFGMIGLVFSDGVVAGSNMVRANPFYTTANNLVAHIFAHGTLTAHSATFGLTNKGTGMGTPIYIQLIWSAANSWKARFSPDGVTWTEPVIGAQAKTMTPTHFGVWVSTWGGASPAVGSFDYFRVYDSDESV